MWRRMDMTLPATSEDTRRAFRAQEKGRVLESHPIRKETSDQGLTPSPRSLFVGKLTATN